MCKEDLSKSNLCIYVIHDRGLQILQRCKGKYIKLVRGEQAPP